MREFENSATRQNGFLMFRAGYFILPFLWCVSAGERGHFVGCHQCADRVSVGALLSVQDHLIRNTRNGINFCERPINGCRRQLNIIEI